MFPISVTTIVPHIDLVLDDLDQICDVVELRLLQHPLLTHHLVQHQLAVPQIVEDGGEVGWVSVYQVCSSLVLKQELISEDNDLTRISE